MLCGAVLVGFLACKEEIVDLPGTISGIATDKATGEPIRSAGVELSPTGMKTVTGSEGQFEFTELDPGTYTLLITKTGYTDFASSTIEVKPGQTAKTDVQIEQLPPALKVVNDQREEISTLDFGAAEADVARSFNIFNDGEASLDYQITKTAIWVDSISKSEGTIKTNGIQPIVVFIDRNKLYEGENSTTIQVTSNSGSKEITVTAMNNRKAISLNILEATNITASSATLNAEILNAGNPKYTERGFVYNTTAMPTLNNTLARLTAPVTTSAKFSASANGLELNKTYFVRAYATNTLGTVYSNNQISFVANATLPTVSTQAVTSINLANGTAIFNGTITKVGDPAYTERGFVYGEVPNPTIDDTKKTVSGKGTGAFSANISGLEEGKTYYVRAYATNAEGTSYGIDVSFSTEATMPTVATNEVTNKNIGAGTVTFNGVVETLGDLSYTERGFVYNTTHNPTIDDTKLVASGSGVGEYSLNATGIKEGAVYYVRAYVTNKKGTVYGEEVSFDFNAEMPTLSTNPVTNKSIATGTATLNGTILTIGDPAFTERGFVYGFSRNPSLADATKIIVSGTETGDYFINVSSLVEGKTYYVRAYATTPNGTVYGEEVSFEMVPSMPDVSTQAVTNKNISAGTATLNGTIEDLGDLGYTEKGFVYGEMKNPSLSDATKVAVQGTEAGAYTVNISNLVENKTYYVRAYATNTKGTVYGEQVSFSTEATMPTVKTNAVTAIKIGAGTAIFNANVLSLGDLGYTERGFVYSNTHNPTVDDIKLIASGTGTGEYSVKATDIAEGTTYYVRAYVKNSKGVVYGEEVSFDFIATMPTVKTNAVTAIKVDLGTAIFNANVLTLGDLGYTERGFVYGNAHNPTVDDTKLVGSGTGTGEYSVKATGLVENTTYYVRAYVMNSKGVVYGEEVSFDCTAQLPVVSTQAVTNKNIGSGIATLNGRIESIGHPDYTERGFVYGLSHNPSIDDATKKTVSGTGAGSFTTNLSNLVMGNLYYVRAYAISTIGTAYGDEVELDFYPIYPSVSTTSVKITSATAALASGSIAHVGDPAYKERGFVYGTMPVPTLDNGASKATAVGTQVGDFQASLTNLNSSSVYYVRAYATSNAGTVYGEIETITEDDWTYFNVPTIEYAGYTYKYYVIGTMTYSQAVQNCSNLNLGGFTDWYLPSKEEIAYIVQMSSLAEEKNKV